MWPLLSAALAIASGGAAGGPPPPEPAAHEQAINPNISLGRCNGGRAIEVRENMPEKRYQGALNAEVSGEQLFEHYCVGYYAEEPQFCFTVPSAGLELSFEVVEASGLDTTMAIVGGTLEWPLCDDDGGQGLMSRVGQRFEGGEYKVYVGAYGRDNSADFTLLVRAGEVW